MWQNFNPRSPCGERLAGYRFYSATKEFQSTLPLWGATGFSIYQVGDLDISIHAPLVGSDETNGGFCAIHMIFQSTLPLWGATCRAGGAPICHKYFNPRSPCGERHGRVVFIGQALTISIHAPLVGSDRKEPLVTSCAVIFQSTLPLWGATTYSVYLNISIHNFNPRSPCGERRCSPRCPWYPPDFNPRSPCGERPNQAADAFNSQRISIHAPLVGSD